MQRNIAFIALLMLLLAGCSLNKKLSQPEDFEKFRKQFYSDSIFHYNRINFPLEMQTIEYRHRLEHDANPTSGPDTIVFTRASLPRTIKGLSEYPEGYQSKIEPSKYGFDEVIFIPGSGYIERRSFSMVDNRWYLIHLFIMNL